MSTTPRTPVAGPLTRDALDTVVRDMCEAADLDPTDAELIKFTNNAVFRLPRSHAVLRIAGSTAARTRAPKVVAVATWLAGHHAPAVRLLPDIPQPLQAAGHVATVWHDVPSVGPPVTGRDLAEILRTFHHLPEPDHALPEWRPLDEIRTRLAEPEGLPDDDLAFLLSRCEDVEESLADVDYQLPPGPIHGDAFLGNLIPGPHGAVICDFDSTSTGPREWDLVPVAVGSIRFDYRDDAQRHLVGAYGFDVTQWPGFPVLRHVRELKLVTSVIPILQSNPRIYPQWRHRMDTFKQGETDATWTTYN